VKSSRTGILGGTRACLCKDGTYSIDCCNGSIWAQGIGNISQGSTEFTYKYRLTKCVTGSNLIAHVVGTELTVGNVYYLVFENTTHNGCYTVTEVHSGSGQQINTVNLYADCTACIAAN